MKTIIKLVALLFFPVLSFGQIELEQKIFLLDNKVEIHVPKELSKMPDEMWVLKYHTLPRPQLVLTDENAEVNFMVDVTKQPASENQMAEYKDFRITLLKKRADVKILADGVDSVNGKNVGFIKFSSQAIDQSVFNFYFFTVVNGKILLCTFNCIEKLQTKWEKTADEILNSLKVK